jgi:hypothetical protein
MQGIIRISKINIVNDSGLLIFIEEIFSEIPIIHDEVFRFQVRTSKTNIRMVKINKKVQTKTQLE